MLSSQKIFNSGYQIDTRNIINGNISSMQNSDSHIKQDLLPEKHPLNDNADPDGKEAEEISTNQTTTDNLSKESKDSEKSEFSTMSNETDSVSFTETIDDTDYDSSILGSKKPLITIIILSLGPIISQIVSSLFGVFNSIWVTKTIGKMGLEVFGAVFIVDYFQIGFAQYLMISINIRISYLYGQKNGKKCAHLYIDFLRLAVLFGIMTCAFVLPITKPLTRWLGASAELSQMCFQYMIPEACLSFVTYIYMIGCGVLQAEGRPFLFCLVQLSTFILNILVFDPLFLLGFKTSIWGCTLATTLSQLIVGGILTFFILKGKFSFKPTKEMLKKKISHETGKALFVGIPELVMELSLSIPLVLMQKYIDKASTAIGIYAEATESWALTQRLYTFVEALELGFVFGYLPAASYSYGAKRYNRMLKLTIHLLWLCTSISSVIAYIIVIFIRNVASIWSKNPDFLNVAVKMVPIIFYAMPLVGLSYMAPALLEAMQKAKRATILSILSLLVTPITISTILYFTKKNDPHRIMYTYPISDAIASLFYIAFTFKPLKILWKAPKDKLELKEEKKKQLGTDDASTNKDNTPHKLNKKKSGSIIAKKARKGIFKGAIGKIKNKKDNEKADEISDDKVSPSPLIPEKTEQL